MDAINTQCTSVLYRTMGSDVEPDRRLLRVTRRRRSNPWAKMLHLRLGPSGDAETMPLLWISRR